MEKKQTIVIYWQLRRRKADGEIETYPIVSESYDKMEQLRDKCNKFMGGGFEIVSWDTSVYEWERLKEETFVEIREAYDPWKENGPTRRQVMDRWASFCYNHPPYDEVILWMVGGDKQHYLYQHFCSKFLHLCEDVCHNDTMSAWMKFYRTLDAQWADRLLEYVYCEWKKQ